LNHALRDSKQRMGERGQILLLSRGGIPLSVVPRRECGEKRPWMGAAAGATVSEAARRLEAGSREPKGKSCSGHVATPQLPCIVHRSLHLVVQHHRPLYDWS
jgi:hypothetical protein